MTFSEYFHALYPYLSDGDKPVDFLDGMIGHFINDSAQEACELLNRKIDTKRRYIQKKNPNKIDPEYARYVYSEHSRDGYISWLYERMEMLDTFDKIEDWLAENDIEFDDVSEKCDELLHEIFFYIAYPEATKGSEVTIPPADETAAKCDSRLEYLSENDQKLLYSFRIDFDSTLRKCITSDMPEAWFTGRVSEKIENLYNAKWKELIPRISDIRIQSDILATVAALREFCDALDPDKKTVSFKPVRKLRMELRDCYVRIHPDKYVMVLPLDNYIDDWDDEEQTE